MERFMLANVRPTNTTVNDNEPIPDRRTDPPDDGGDNNHQNENTEDEMLRNVSTEAIPLAQITEVAGLFQDAAA